MKRAGIILIAGLSFAAVALAQETMPKPTPEHKKLDTLAGSWVLEGDVKPSAMGPGGKIMENEKCEWMEGGFFLVCHVDFKTASSGNGSGRPGVGPFTRGKDYPYRGVKRLGGVVGLRE